MIRQWLLNSLYVLIAISVFGAFSYFLGRGLMELWMWAYWNDKEWVFAILFLIILSLIGGWLFL